MPISLRSTLRLTNGDRLLDDRCWPFLSMLSLMIGSKMMNTQSPPACLDQKVASLGDWRADVLTRMGVLIGEADPDMVEQVKWVKPTTDSSGVPVWEHAGIICTGEVYKTYVKLTFASGAALNDAAGLFNVGLGGGTRRAIDIREGETIDAKAFKALFAEAVAYNCRKKGRSVD